MHREGLGASPRVGRLLSFSLSVPNPQKSQPNPMFVSQYRRVYVERVPVIKWRVLLDGNLLMEVEDYLVGVAACMAWRRNNPREDKHRIRLVNG